MFRNAQDPNDVVILQDVADVAGAALGWALMAPAIGRGALGDRSCEYCLGFLRFGSKLICSLFWMPCKVFLPRDGSAAA